MHLKEACVLAGLQGEFCILGSLRGTLGRLHNNDGSDFFYIFYLHMKERETLAAATKGTRKLSSC